MRRQQGTGMSQTLNKKQIDAILHSDLHDPFGVLGAHVLTLRGQKQVAVRAFLRDAKEAVVAELDGERRIGWQCFNQLERPGILFEQRAGIDQVGGAQADAAKFPHDKTEGQVGVTRQRREE